METTSKPKVTIPLVAAISIPYTAIPINLFRRGKIDTSAKTNIKSNRAQPYTTASAAANNDTALARKQHQRQPCSNCHKHLETLTSSAATTASLVAAISTVAAATNTTTATSSEQTAAANIKLSTMFNGSPSAMLIVPFMQASNLSSQRGQKMLPTLYCTTAGQPSKQLQHHTKDLSRVRNSPTWSRDFW